MKWLKRKLIKWLFDPEVLKDVELRLPYLRVGSGTVEIDGEAIRFPALTSDPSTLRAGLLWYRGDSDEWKYSPDGANMKKLGPAEIGMNEQSFTSTGLNSWTVPNGVNVVYILVVGGGGGGGNTSECEGAGGGGGGGEIVYAIGYVEPGESLSIYVGAGGGAASDGEASYVQGKYFYVEALGGKAGSNGSGSIGGAGGAGGSGGEERGLVITYRTPGANGGKGAGNKNTAGSSGGSITMGTVTFSGGAGGAGGSYGGGGGGGGASFGNGGKGGNGMENGNNGGLYGGGGGGAGGDYVIGYWHVGGSGAQGIVKIWYAG